MLKSYYSRGKILISGEYLIVNGCTGLAVPSIYGQYLNFLPCYKSSILNWKSIDKNKKIWFEASFFKKKKWQIKNVSKKNFKKAEFLVKIINTIELINPDVNIAGNIICTLEFDRKWGLGSSSTLINNLAKLSDVNPFKLFFSISNGSGYDIACAEQKTPILYQKKESIVITPISIKWPFINNIFFVYLNKKEDSSKSITNFLNKKTDLSAATNSISVISNELYQCNSFNDFSKLICEHEDILSKVLDRAPIKKIFADFNGPIKSLGAWGGDFIMAGGNYDEVKTYFNSKGYYTIIGFKGLLV